MGLREAGLNGGILELLEACVLLQSLREVLGCLCPKAVVEKAATNTKSIHQRQLINSSASMGLNAVNDSQYLLTTSWFDWRRT